MNIVFLDIDGVLNWGPMTDNLRPWPDACSPAAVARLYDLVTRGNARIVVSSTWRLYHSDEWLEGFLSAHGLDRILTASHTEPHIIGRTSRKLSSHRGQEISWWLQDYDERVGSGSLNAEWGPIEAYVVLDDDDDSISALHPERLILTDNKKGLTDDDVERAIEILNTPITE